MASESLPKVPSPAVEAGERFQHRVGRAGVDRVDGPDDGVVLRAGVQPAPVVEGDVLGALAGYHRLDVGQFPTLLQRPGHRRRVRRVPLGGVDSGVGEADGAGDGTAQESGRRERVPAEESKSRANTSPGRLLKAWGRTRCLRLIVIAVTEGVVQRFTYPVFCYAESVDIGIV